MSVQTIVRYRFLIFLPAALLLTLGSSAPAQNDSSSQPDTQIVFGTLVPRSEESLSSNEIVDAMGVDLLVTTSGFGMGLFYRHEYADDIAGTIDFSIADARDDREFEYYDSYTNQFYSPGKLSRFLVMPLYIGIQVRLFKDEIMDNFRPFINGAVGPTMIYVFPYNQEYFDALGDGRAHFTVGGYVGLGAYFGSERASLFGLNIRYSYVPVTGGLESLQFFEGKVEKKYDFGSFMITLSWGAGW